MGTFGNSRHNRRRGGYVAGGGVRPIFGEGDLYGAKPDYKTAALCKQVRRVISMVLSGECGDAVLQSLMVDEVMPAPNAGRLLVRVLLRTRDGGPTAIDVLERLGKVEGLLRARVGETITRQRTPELAFDVIPITPRPAESEVAGE